MITARHWEIIMGRIVNAARDDWPVKPYVLWQQADQPNSGGPTGVMVGCDLDSDAANRLVALGATQPAEKMHMSLLFLEDDAEELTRSSRVENLLAAVEGWARLTSPLEAKINGLGVFNPGPQSDTPVTYANVDCPALPEARQDLVHQIAAAGLRVDTTHGHVPHITCGYGDVSTKMQRPDVFTVFRTVTVAIGPSKVSFKLGGVGTRL